MRTRDACGEDAEKDEQPRGTDGRAEREDVPVLQAARKSDVEQQERCDDDPAERDEVARTGWREVHACRFVSASWGRAHGDSPAWTSPPKARAVSLADVEMGTLEAKTGMLASHAPSTKKQVMAHQHMSAATPHVRRGASGTTTAAGEGTATDGTCVRWVSPGWLAVAMGTSSISSTSAGGNRAADGGSWNRHAATTQNADHTPAMTHPGLQPVSAPGGRGVAYARGEPVEHAVVEAHAVQQPAEKRTHGHARSLGKYDPAGERGATAHADETRVGAVALAVHKADESDPADDTAQENEVQLVKAVGERVNDVPENGGGATDVQGEFIAACQRVSGEVKTWRAIQTPIVAHYRQQGEAREDGGDTNDNT